jgi:hypothetical protein
MLRLLAAIACSFVTVLVLGVTAPLPINPETNIVVADPYLAAEEEIQTYFDAAQDGFAASVQTELAKLDGDKGKANTAVIDELAANARTAADAAEPFGPFDHMYMTTVAHPMNSAPSIVEQKAAIDAKVDEALKPVVDAVAAWQTEVAAENERIRAAEAETARVAAEAEAARVAAAQRATSSPSPSGRSGGTSQSTAPAPQASGGESADARIQRLMGRAGVSFSYAIADCGIANALGCYNSNGMIYFTQRGLRDDCTIMRVITHEYRHLQQHRQGLIQVDANGQVTNRDWLEADANAHTYC